MTTNIPCIISLCDHKEFINGNVHTDFIPMHREELFASAKQANIDDEIICCSLSSILNHEANLFNSEQKSENILNESVPYFWTNSALTKEYNLQFNNQAKTGKLFEKFI